MFMYYNIISIISLVTKLEDRNYLLKGLSTISFLFWFKIIYLFNSNCQFTKKKFLTVYLIKEFSSEATFQWVQFNFPPLDGALSHHEDPTEQN